MNKPETFCGQGAACLIDYKEPSLFLGEYTKEDQLTYLEVRLKAAHIKIKILEEEINKLKK